MPVVVAVVGFALFKGAGVLPPPRLKIPPVGAAVVAVAGSEVLGADVAPKPKKPDVDAAVDVPAADEAGVLVVPIPENKGVGAGAALLVWVDSGCLPPVPTPPKLGNWKLPVCVEPAA